jgi:hypothetical protein
VDYYRNRLKIYVYLQIKHQKNKYTFFNGLQWLRTYRVMNKLKFKGNLSILYQKLLLILGISVFLIIKIKLDNNCSTEVAAIKRRSCFLNLYKVQVVVSILLISVFSIPIFQYLWNQYSIHKDLCSLLVFLKITKAILNMFVVCWNCWEIYVKIEIEKCLK